MAINRKHEINLVLAHLFVRAVNGNSKLNEKAQHLYEIYDSTGKVVKTGVSGGEEVAGESARALKQINQWEKEGKVAAGELKHKIVDRVGAGTGARGKVLELESANANRLRSLNEGHLTNKDFHVKP
jgi:URI fold toxin 2